MKNKKILLIGGIVSILLLIIGGVVVFLVLRDRAEEVDQQEALEQVLEGDIVVEGDPMLVWEYEYEDEDIRAISLAVSPDGETYAVGAYLTTYIHHLYDASPVDVILYPHDVADLQYSPDGNLLAGATYSGYAIMDVSDGSEFFRVRSSNQHALSFSPDGTKLATVDYHNILIWDIENSEEPLIEIDCSEFGDRGDHWLRGIDFHPSENIVAVSNAEEAFLWNLDDEEMIFKMENIYGGNPNAIKFSPDGEIMAAVVREDSENRMVRLWDVEELEVLWEVPFEYLPNSVAFSLDGNMLTVTSLYMKSTIWDVETGQLMYTLNQQMDPDTVANGSSAALFTLDGGHLLILRNRGPVELWRLPGGEPIEARPVDIGNPPPLPSDVLFDANEAVLKESANEELEEFANELYAEFKDARITFIGHTTSYAEEAFNLELSTNRANAVREWFENWASDNGVDGWELFAEGRGSSDLKVPDFDSEGNFLETAGALNRRVEIEIETE